MRKYGKIFLATALILAAGGAALAAPHITGKRIKGEPRDYVHRIPDVRGLRSQKLSPALVQKAIGATGTKKIGVLIVGFPSAGLDTSGSHTIANIPAIRTRLDKVNAFYREASYSLLNASFSVITTTFVANNSMAYYGYPDADQTDLLITETIQKSGITKGTGANQCEAIMVIHAGYGNESTSGQDNGDIWSAMYTFTNVGGFTEGLVVSELESGADPLGVWCHEMGHQFGLPDLYATDSRSDPSQVGYWDLMDMGTWSGSGANPSHPGAWCKNLLGWLTPTTVSSVSQVQLSPLETTAQAVKILIPTASDPANEYFLFEYRSKTAAVYDAMLPGSGVLIWHIDDSVNNGSVWYDGSYDTRLNLNIINNSYGTDHRGVSIVAADLTDPSAVAGAGQNLGDSTDAWPGLKTLFASPDSDAFNGKSSGIVAAGFALLAGKMDFSVSTLLFASTVSVEKAVNYPNPAGPAYPVSSSKPAGTITTIAFTFTRPPQEMELSIYDFYGTRIKAVPAGDIRFRGDAAGPTRDYKWVYEYDWDGRNGSGEPVADGAYFYKLRADGKIKTGKMAVVR